MNYFAHSLVVIGFMSVAAVRADDVASTARVTLASGPQAGKYVYSSHDPCMLAPITKDGPLSFSHFLVSDKSTIAVDIPNADAEHLAQFQIELVVANPQGDTSRKQTASVKYVVDTRPDNALAPYQRNERGANGLTGRGTLQLQQQEATARVEFQGETAQGVKFVAVIECLKLDREFGR